MPLAEYECLAELGSVAALAAALEAALVIDPDFDLQDALQRGRKLDDRGIFRSWDETADE